MKTKDVQIEFLSFFPSHWSFFQMIGARPPTATSLNFLFLSIHQSHGGNERPLQPAISPRPGARPPNLSPGARQGAGNGGPGPSADAEEADPSRLTAS